VEKERTCGSKSEGQVGVQAAKMTIRRSAVRRDSSGRSQLQLWLTVAIRDIVTSVSKSLTCWDIQSKTNAARSAFKNLLPPRFPFVPSTWPQTAHSTPHLGTFLFNSSTFNSLHTSWRNKASTCLRCSSSSSSPSSPYDGTSASPQPPPLARDQRQIALHRV
jgi:hypothetical protein